MNLTDRAQTIWPEICADAGLPQTGWSFETLWLRTGPGDSRVVLKVSHPGGQQVVLKCHDTPPADFAERLTRHQKIAQGFPTRGPFRLIRLRHVSPEHACAVYDFAEGRSLNDHLMAMHDKRPKLLQAVEAAGAWLDRFHRCGAPAAHPVNPNWGLQKFGPVRDAIEAGERQLRPARPFARAVLALERLAPRLRGQSTLRGLVHGDFHAGNLIRQGHRLTGIDLDECHQNVIGYDIARFLIRLTRKFDSRRQLSADQPVADDTLAAFFRGYQLAGPDDPSVRVHLICRLLEDWLAVPQQASAPLHDPEVPIRRMARKAFDPKTGAAPELCLLLSDRLLKAARGRKHRLIGHVEDAARVQGFDVSFRKSGPAGQRAARHGQAVTLSHMSPAPGPRSFCFRRVYSDRFWQIERMQARWDWEVARKSFDPGQVPGRVAQEFWAALPARTRPATRDGFVYMPLQGRLSEHRSFQHCAPVQMIRETARHCLRPIFATLHPGESYDADEQAALAALAQEFPHFTVTDLPMEKALAGCDFVVTQNSSAAFHGLRYEKPAILFAAIDFHHICLNVSALGVAEAFERIGTFRPDVVRYLYWFWKENTLDLASGDAADQVARRLRQLLKG